MIAGYAKRDAKKWPLVVAGLVIVFGIFLILLLIVPPPGSQYKPAVKPAQPKAQVNKPTPSVEAANKVREDEKPVESKLLAGEIKVEKIILASEIDDRNLPLDDLIKISLEESGRIYCYTRMISEKLPQTIRHRWIGPAGIIVAEIPLTITHRPADTWSYINLSATEPGEWTVEVRDIGGKLLASRKITTH